MFSNSNANQSSPNETMSIAASHRSCSQGFAFTRRTRLGEGADRKYPEGRQASAVIPLLWRAQEQDDGWLPQEAIEHVAEMLGMAHIRVLEVATFYTMFLLAPVGRKAHVQVCGTTPCMLRGAEDADRGLPASASHEPLHVVGRRQFLLGRGRVPRRLRQRADGADLKRYLRGPDRRELREDARRARGRQAQPKPGPADRPAILRAGRRADHADRSGLYPMRAPSP